MVNLKEEIKILQSEIDRLKEKSDKIIRYKAECQFQLENSLRKLRKVQEKNEN